MEHLRAVASPRIALMLMYLNACLAGHVMQVGGGNPEHSSTQILWYLVNLGAIVA